VVPHAASLQGMELSRWTVIVIDAIRASSTIAQAIASGCRRVIPVATIREAHATRRALAADRPLLGGERRGLRIEGFDLGNSPREYTPEAVAGRSIILTTTNGTKAIRAAAGARAVLSGAFVNLPAVVAQVRRRARVLIVPVGRSNAPVLDDVVCTGMFVERLLEVGATATPEAEVARMAYAGYRDRLVDALRESASGQALLKAGLGDDLPYCAQVGLLNVVPRLENGGLVP